MDIATLGIKVSADGVSQAAAQLDRLSETSKNVERQAESLAVKSVKALTKTSDAYRSFVSERKAEYGELEGGVRAAMTRINSEWDKYREHVRDINREAARRNLAEQASAQAPWQSIRERFQEEQRLYARRNDAISAFEQQLTQEVNAEVAKRSASEKAARDARFAGIRESFQEEQRLAKMRADAIAAFSSPEVRAAELTQKAAEREAGIRQRLSALLATERGQRILEAESARKQSSALGGVASSYAAAGLSARQLLQAQRQLPAQFTDIFTTLQAGQSPLQVLLQQGGQLKDVFGGIGPALRASVGYLVGLINPMTAAAAAAAALGFAWKQQSDQLAEFNISLARTHNAIGLTAEQLQDMARQIDRAGNATIGGAADAVNRLVSGGKIAGDQLRAVAAATAEWSAVSGDSIDKIAGKFESLSKSPLDALLKLNEAERFLTREQADRIRTLQEEGREQEAVSEAVRIYTSSLNDATKAARGNLSEMGKLWASVKNEVAGAWAEVQTYVGLLDKAAKQQVGGGLSTMLGYAIRNNGAFTALRLLNQYGQQKTGAFSGVSSRVLGASAVDSDEYRAEQKAAEDRKKALADFQRDEFRYLDDKAKKLKDVAAVNDLVTKGIITQGEATKRIALIEDSYARKAERSRSKTDYGAPLLQSIRQQIALNEEQSRSEEGLTQSQRLRVRIVEQLSSLGDKLKKGQREEIEAALQQLQVTDEQNQSIQAQLRLKEDMGRLTAQLNAAEENRRRSGEAELIGLTQGSDAAERARRRLDVEREYQDGLRSLRDRGVAEDSESWKAQEQLLRESRDRMLQIDQDFYQQRDAAQSDWTNGLKRGLQDYVTYASDIASRTADAVDGIVGALQGTFETFFRTGKLDWKGFLDDVNAQLARFFSQQLVKQLIEGFGQGSGQSSGSGGGGWTQMIGQVIGSFFGGGRASGGPMRAGTLYEVGEKRPEVFQSGGRLWMVPSRDGYMHPDTSLVSGGGGVAVNQTIVVQGTPNRRTASQIAIEAGREMQRATGRNGR